MTTTDRNSLKAKREAARISARLARKAKAALGFVDVKGTFDEKT